MILRRPTKTTLKMEDDMTEYEDIKKEQENQKKESGMKFTSNAFLTPNSIKFKTKFNPDEEWNNSEQLNDYGTLRSNPLNSVEEDQQMDLSRSNEHIITLLSNIRQEGVEEEHQD